MTGFRKKAAGVKICDEKTTDQCKWVRLDHICKEIFEKTSRDQLATLGWGLKKENVLSIAGTNQHYQ